MRFSQNLIDILEDVKWIQRLALTWETIRDELASFVQNHQEIFPEDFKGSFLKVAFTDFYPSSTWYDQRFRALLMEWLPSGYCFGTGGGDDQHLLAIRKGDRWW